LPNGVLLIKEEGDMKSNEGNGTRILFLHHSTGGVIWEGGVPQWFERYNREHATDYRIVEREFPKDEPYGWRNYPYDYWNIWVRNAGERPFMEEPTLEMLTKEWDLIVFKHCYPVSNVRPDAPTADVASDVRTLANYKLQYEALKAKLRAFPRTRFIVWTGALTAEDDGDAERSERARAFFSWVKETWDERGDNVFVWDFAALEGEGGIFLKKEHQAAPSDSHPNNEFARKAAPLFCRRIVDVIEGRGDTGSLTGA
jgi:hypothetical protein